MKGFSFSFDSFDYSSLEKLSDCFGITSLLQIINSQVPFPQTLQESIDFISQPYCGFLEDHFNHSLKVIIQNFTLISFDELSKLKNSHLIKIFSSDFLQIESEDYLFQIITKMIEKDKNRMLLLRSVKLDYVSNNLLKEFIDNISNDEIDFEFFEALKKRLFADYSDQQTLSKRWITKPKVLSSSGIAELFGVFNSYFGKEQHPLLGTDLLIEQIKQLKQENEDLKLKNNHFEENSTLNSKHIL
jgi:hypothetical protein